MRPTVPYLPARPMELALCATLALGLSSAMAEAPRSVHERLAADPKGTVEIENVAGKVTLAAWDRDEVEVSGTIGPRVEKVEVVRSGSRVSVRVIVPHQMFSSGRDHDAILNVYIPRSSAASASLVSADLVVSGIRGFETLQTVSGNIVGEVGGEAKIRAVSGDVDVEAPGTQPIELQTVSGNVHVNTLALQVAVESVSGDERVLSTGASHLRLHTVSGEIQLVAAVASGGSIEAETISGDVKIDLAGPLAGSYDLRTLSGDISNCFGPKAVRPQYGPGARASFRDGDGTGHVSVESKSGDVHLCNQAAAPPGPHVVNARPEERTPSNRT